MQLVTAAAARPVPAIRTIHLTSHGQTAQPWVTTLRTTYVGFAIDAADPYGGTVSQATIVDGKVSGMTLRGYSNRPSERAAAQAVLDAIAASGLLERELPTNDWQRPAVGRSRLYLDRRARFIEFDTANPPAVVQGILGALDRYERGSRSVPGRAA